MTISIQGSAAALATLDNLSQAPPGAAGAAPPPGAAGADAPGRSSAIIDLSGLAPGAVGGPAASLANSGSITDAALAAGTLIEGLLAQMRQDAVSAADPALDGDARAALDSGFQGGLGQIQAAVGAANVGGVNLLDRTSGGQAPLGLTAFDFRPGGPLIGVAAGASLSDPAASASLAEQLGAALDNVGQALGQISAQGEVAQGEASQGGLASLAGSGGLAGFNPGLDADGARLAALQVQQQLVGGGGSIANQAPQSILALFR